MTKSNYGISRFQSVIAASKLPPQDQQNPVVNNNFNSLKDGTYPYNAPKQGAVEPVVTSKDGATSSKPVDPHPNYGESGIQRLQNRLRIATSPQGFHNTNNTANLGIAKEQFNMQDTNYKEMIPYLAKQADKDFNKMATYSAISGLGGAISGANAQYQSWWGGGLVK